LATSCCGHLLAKPVPKVKANVAFGQHGPIAVLRNLDRPRHIPLENLDARYPRAHEATAERDAPLAGRGRILGFQNFPPSESSYCDPSGRVTRTAASGKAASSRPARSGGVT
jgi:hypothetical protein